MTYKSILVNFDVDRPPGRLLDFALDVATRFGAHLIGFCAADARMPLIGGEAAAAAALWVQERADIADRISRIKEHFEKSSKAATSEWRQTHGDPTQGVLSVASQADLIITDAAGGPSSASDHRRIDPGELLINAGRPVLFPADGALRIGTRAVVAWKDTREARRAVAFALPLLQLASDVVVLSIHPNAEIAKFDTSRNVAAFLNRHEIPAEHKILVDDHEHSRMTAFVADREPGFIVSGAYGHSRLREWAFGGITRSLLEDSSLNRMMAS